MKRFLYILILIITVVSDSMGQDNSGVIKGRIFNAKTNEGVPFATVQIFGTTIGAISDYDGNYSFTGIKPGFV